MLCTACGGIPSDESWKKRVVKLRFTGRSDEPYVAVCECCGCDVDYEPRSSSAASRVSVLSRPATGSAGPTGLFHP